MHERAAAGDPARVLVAYVTSHGSTAGVADRIGAILRRQGHTVEVREAALVDDVTACTAVVFGSPVFNQRWLPAGERFVGANADALAQRPLWLFSVGTFGTPRRSSGRS